MTITMIMVIAIPVTLVAIIIKVILEKIIII